MNASQAFQMMVLTPPRPADPSLAIAASLAGETGVLDLEYVEDEETGRTAVRRLARYGGSRIGVKFGALAPHLFCGISALLPEPVSVVILTYSDPDQLLCQMQELDRDRISVLLECTSVAQARVGEQIGVNGVIAKGQEAGGRVGEETTFVLLQRFLTDLSLPVWAQGGIGLHTASACYAAGAVGVVLDSQLYLTRESSLSGSVRSKIAAMDGSETVCLGQGLGECYRVYVRPGMPAVAQLQEEERRLAESGGPRTEVLATWREAVRQRIGWTEEQLWLLGQDAAAAAPLVKQFGNVPGVLRGMRRAVRSHWEGARALRPLDEHAPLAVSHGTRYPIVQGPMTRVSDVPAFATAVAEGGALPFLALALMRGPDVRRLLEETKRRLKDRAWGVGILGFVPLELREEQLAAISACHPPFALIAGGRPDQARSLEAVGVPTYLHVPSPGLLKLFLANGARRFVFEGRECGGHVGPRSSFMLWESMIEVLLEHLSGDRKAQEHHILFAGGIHDALSASMVAVMAAPLAERGVRIGVLMGTAYLFTEEAVASGAIVRAFQEEAIRCDRTSLLETGPGHATRCLETPYVQTFLDEKRRLFREGCSPDEIRFALEELNLGRLRIASKGIMRQAQASDQSSAPFVTLGEEDQRQQGMYMIGQVAALRSGLTTIADLHQDVAVGGSQRLAALPQPDGWTTDEDEAPHARKTSRPSDIAIIGMSCVFPRALNLQAYWHNILNKVDAITEIPSERWDWRRYYDPAPRAKDKVYSRWGGFIEDVLFDPMSYGMPPSSLSSIEPLHLLTLEAVRAALKDANYLDRPFDRERVAVILGAGGAGDLGQLYGVRAFLPELFGDSAADIMTRLDDRLPEWTEDSFSGILMNVAAGRVANRFDLGGANYTVDAACASSLAAVSLAARELEEGTSDMVIVGGADTIQSPFAFLCFSKTYALSASGRCRPFDEKADGIAISEGIGVLILKRLADAERDGDRIYAVIKGVGGASDGRDKGLTAPRPEGQVRTLRRAYNKAGISPATVGLIEAHGTGTVVGDRTELQALGQVFDGAKAAPQSCAIGSVKSMIGHTKNTAGVAGLIKVALALHHKVLPPTINVEKPNARFSESPFYVNTEVRPWIQGVVEHPRRAGVSAFGFGGTNFHVVLEESTGDYLTHLAKTPRQRPSELFIWRHGTREGLISAINSLQKVLAEGARPSLPDLAYTVHNMHEAGGDAGESPELTLAVVAASPEDLVTKLAAARESLASSATVRIADPRGVYLSERPLAREGKLAFLFPGQGSQYINMFQDLAIDFAEVREHFERADQALKGMLPQPLSAYIFPPPGFSREEEQARQDALTQTNVAQPAMGAVDLAVFRLLERLGVHPDFVAGHSYGEYVALCAAGVFREEQLLALSEARGRFMVEGGGEDPGTMAAVDAGPEVAREVLASVDGIVLANLNTPRQTVIAGARPAVEQAIERLKGEGIRARHLPVACAFHSPLVAPAQEKLAGFLASLELNEPRLEVFSNTTAAPHPRDPKAIAAQLVEHVVRPVRFVDEIEALYAAGARIFVEVGPRNVLSSFTDQILGDRPHVTIAADQPGRSPTVQFLHLLGRLAAEGVPVQVDRLFEGRSPDLLDVDHLPRGASPDKPASGVWLVNGGRARPAVDGSQPGMVRAERQPARTDASNDHTPAPAAESIHKPPMAPPVDVQSPRPPVVAPPPPRTEPERPVREAMPRPATVTGNGDDEAQVMSRFQQLMLRFLDTQQNVMLAYLRGRPGGVRPDVDKANVPTPLFAIPPSPAPELVEVPAQAVPAQPASTRPNEGSQNGPQPVGGEPAPEEAGTSLGTPLPPNEQELTSQLLQLVSERTGYPPEMLDLDLDVEADLGIDSIKRVEILGNFQRLYAPADDMNSAGEMEKLTTSRTLRAIIEWVTKSTGSTPPVARPRGAALSAPEGDAGGPVDRREGESGGERTGGGPLCRHTFAPTELPYQGQAGSLECAGVIVLTDDEHGIAQAVADQLSERGREVAFLRAGGETAVMAPGSYTADLTSANAVAEALGLIRARQGPIGGLVHLLPLKGREPFDGVDLATWQRGLQLEVKSLFYLAKGLHGELMSAAQRGGACVLAATGMGGDSVAHRGDFFPGQGGVTGLMKTLACEWPEVRLKAVDLNPREPPTVLTTHLLREFLAPDDQIEVGYQGQRRLSIQPVTAPVRQDGVPALAIDSSWVIVVTGGARGITAEVARHLAEHYRPTLLLVGRSPLPPSAEPPETVGLTSPQELKAALMAGLAREGQPVALARVEAAYARLTQDREIRKNLAAMEQAGARVHYCSLDVRDTVAFGDFIDRAYETYGRIDGVIHGAGVIEDKLIQDKSSESFDRVFDTKVNGAVTLSRKLRPDSLKFLAFFTSAAGKFGNRGQSDYAAANEVINKLALYLDSRWSGRVVSVNWGPWAGLGMVSPELQQEFTRRGIKLISPPEGCRGMDQELRYGCKGEVEVLLTAGGWEAPRVAQSPRQTLVLPMLNRDAPSRGAHGSLAVVRTLDASRDPYLRDHQLNGKPVFPMAVALELMAETAAQACPTLEPVAVRDLQVLQGIVLEHGMRAIRALAKPPTTAANGGRQVEVSIAGPEASQRPYYQAVVELAPSVPPAASVQPPLRREAGSFPLSVEDAYRQWLFQGPVFRGVIAVHGIDGDGITGSLAPSSPQKLLGGDAEGPWLIDPVVIDSGLQLLILWARRHWDTTPLPSGFRLFRRFGPLSGPRIDCQVRIHGGSDGRILRADLFFIGGDGGVLGILEGLECACIKSLNPMQEGLAS